MCYEPQPRRPLVTWTLIRCPRCDWAVMSESDEVVDTLLHVHIEVCGRGEDA
jgi:hypothetical protein